MFTRGLLPDGGETGGLICGGPGGAGGSTPESGCAWAFLPHTKT